MPFTQLQPPAELLGRTELIASFAVLFVILCKWLLELWLETLNQRHLAGRPGAGSETLSRSQAAGPTAPPAIAGSPSGPGARQQPGAEPAGLDDPSVKYTLAKSQFHQVQATVEMILLVLILSSGVLSGVYQFFSRNFGSSHWAQAAYVFAIIGLLGLVSMPFSWYTHFHLEQRFGFNTLKPKLWWIDRGKGALLAIMLGYPFLVLVLKTAEWAGPRWWIYAWLMAFAFQLLIFLLAPVLILPLFNRFAPLPESSLKKRLLDLAARTGFQASGIQVMDGSKRSRHSNAFFTGFGRFRRIVLFDTLIEQLNEPQIEAVLAHEIGHYKKFHVPKTLIAFGLALFTLFWLVGELAARPWFLQAFRLPHGNVASALLVLTLLSGTFTFWFAPLVNYWSRKFEFQADAYAVQTMQESRSLVAALRKLNEKNLSNPSPHPYYRRFYYSHPTLAERENALQKV